MAKTVTITQQVKELIHDVRNKAFLMGKAREAENSKDYEAASNMQASDEESDSYQIRRSLTSAFAAIKSGLSEYLNEDKTTADNLVIEEIDNDGVLTLVFSMPDNYNCAAVDSLSENIHAYLVDCALVEWFSITDKEDAATFGSHSAATIENVKKALYNRKRPERPAKDNYGNGQ